MSIRLCWLMVLLSSISLLIFSLVVPSVVERGVLTSPTIIMDLFISPFSFISFDSHFFFSSFVQCRHIQDYSVFFIIILYPTLPLITFFALKSISFDNNTAFFLINFPFVYFEPGYVVIFEMSFLQKVYRWVMSCS